jgi:hypothetical protein
VRSATERPIQAARESIRRGLATREENQAVSQDINVLALVKGEERYIFLFDDNHRAEALRTLGRYASNPELSFTWYDAAVLSQKIRQAFGPPSESAVQARFCLPQEQDEFEDDR